jgi:hypothetical protein
MSDKDRTDQRMFSVFTGVGTDLRRFPNVHQSRYQSSNVPRVHQSRY